MTFYTSCFLRDKAAGNVRKCGRKASFFDGNRCYYRALWHNSADGRDYVILNGEAYPFRAYREQPYDFIIGRI